MLQGPVFYSFPFCTDFPDSQHVTSPKPSHCKLNPSLPPWSISLGVLVNPQRDKHFLLPRDLLLLTELFLSNQPLWSQQKLCSIGGFLDHWQNDKMESYYFQMTEKSWSIEQNLLGMLVNNSHCSHESLNSLLRRRD